VQEDPIHNRTEGVSVAGRVLRPYQVEAIDAIVAALADGGSGQLHAACGSGKTLMAMRAAERLAGPDGLVVVLAPSLGLVAQIIGDWFDESRIGFQSFAVCSDESIAGDDDVRTTDLHVPVSTDPTEIAKWLGTEGPKLIVGTYLSGLRLAEAVRFSNATIDLLVCDEAHHLAGAANAPTRRIVDDAVLPARRRLYVTATPRIDGRAGGQGPRALSMDGEAFGPVIYSYPFSRAISEGYLSDYRIAVIGVTGDEVVSLLNQDDVEFTEGVSARSAAAQVALARAYQEFGMRRAVTFHSTVNEARRFIETLPQTLAALPTGEDIPTPTCLHANGTMPAAERRQVLVHLAQPPEGGWAVASNARCLSEGVDVPAVDGILFTHAKRSVVDVVQAAGRALRIHPDAPGPSTVIVPVVLPAAAEGDFLTSTNLGGFDTLVSIVRALRNHDDMLAADLDRAQAVDRNATSAVETFGKIAIVMPDGTAPSLLNSIRLLILDGASNPRNVKWWSMFNKATSYYQEMDRLKASNLRKGDELSKWFTIQRSARRRGELDALRVDALDGIGFAWDPADERQRYETFHRTHCRGDRLVCLPAGFDGSVHKRAPQCACFATDSFVPVSRSKLGGVALRQFTCESCHRVWVEKFPITMAISTACDRWVTAAREAKWHGSGDDHGFWASLRNESPGLYESVAAAKQRYAEAAREDLNALLPLSVVLDSSDVDYLRKSHPAVPWERLLPIASNAA
jgi:superfamily II DNA or RNA helicase